MNKPQELVILSGKGGCGKTSITACFSTLARNAILADCDVDAADLHLVLSPTSTQSEDFYSGQTAGIDPTLCTRCGACQTVCRFDAIRMVNNHLSVQDLQCEGCGVCHDHCPASAIHMNERCCGSLSVSTTSWHPLVHARLGPGGENSGKLVSAVRERARELAEQHAAELILVDGPPGIGCPVIASLAGTSHCIVVTEPTLSGCHDLERVLELTTHFDIPASVIVNKADINTDITKKIQNIAEKLCTYLGSLPYDRKVIEAQRKRVPVIEYDCEIARRMKEMWNRIEKNTVQLPVS